MLSVVNYFKLHILQPGLTCTMQQKAVKNVFTFLGHVQDDLVFLPVCRSLDGSVAHIVETEYPGRTPLAVDPHPHTNSITTNILSLDKARHSEPLATIIIGANRLYQGSKAGR